MNYNYTISKNISFYSFGACSISNQGQVKSTIGIKSSSCNFSSSKNNSFKSSFSISNRKQISFQSRAMVNQTGKSTSLVSYSVVEMNFQKRLSKQASISRGFKQSNGRLVTLISNCGQLPVPINRQLHPYFFNQLTNKFRRI